jgi:hypothetical protein
MRRGRVAADRRAARFEARKLESDAEALAIAVFSPEPASTTIVMISSSDFP